MSQISQRRKLTRNHVVLGSCIVGRDRDGGQTRIDFPNDHLQYAITWFGLAPGLFAVYLVYHHSRGRLTF